MTDSLPDQINALTPAQMQILVSMSAQLVAEKKVPRDTLQGGQLRYVSFGSLTFTLDGGLTWAECRAYRKRARELQKLKELLFPPPAPEPPPPPPEPPVGPDGEIDEAARNRVGDDSFLELPEYDEVDRGEPAAAAKQAPTPIRADATGDQAPAPAEPPKPLTDDERDALEDQITQLHLETCLPVLQRSNPDWHSPKGEELTAEFLADHVSPSMLRQLSDFLWGVSRMLA